MWLRGENGEDGCTCGGERVWPVVRYVFLQPDKLHTNPLKSKSPLRAGVNATDLRRMRQKNYRNRKTHCGPESC